jgi:hypothetical protein
VLFLMDVNNRTSVTNTPKHRSIFLNPNSSSRLVNIHETFKAFFFTITHIYCAIYVILRVHGSNFLSKHQRYLYNLPSFAQLTTQ